MSVGDYDKGALRNVVLRGAGDKEGEATRLEMMVDRSSSVL